MAACVFLAVSCKQGKGDAEKYANSWAKKHYAKSYSMVECSASDSDENGYVSCTVFFKAPKVKAGAVGALLDAPDGERWRFIVPQEDSPESRAQALVDLIRRSTP